MAKCIRENGKHKKRPSIDPEELNKPIIRMVESNPSFVSCGKILDFLLIYGNAFVGIEEVMPDSGNSKKSKSLGDEDEEIDKKPTYKFKVLWGDSLEGYEKAEKLLTSRTTMVENMKADSRDIFLINPLETEHGEFLNIPGLSISQIEIMKDFTYPKIVFINSDGDIEAFPYHNQASFSHPKLKGISMCLVLTRILTLTNIETFMKAYASTVQGKPPEEYTHSTCVGCKLDGVDKIFLSEWPNDEKMSAYPLWIKSLEPKFRNGISELVVSVQHDFSPLVEWMKDEKIILFPDFHKMNQEEFDSFKIDTQSIWEPYFDDYKSNFLTYKTILLNLTTQGMDNCLPHRTSPFEFTISSKNFTTIEEYNIFMEKKTL